MYMYILSERLTARAPCGGRRPTCAPKSVCTAMSSSNSSANWSSASACAIMRNTFLNVASSENSRCWRALPTSVLAS
jgi:hypothetical protein